MLTFPRLAVITGILAFCGALVSSSFSHWAWVFAPAVFALLLGYWLICAQPAMVEHPDECGRELVDGSELADEVMSLPVAEAGPETSPAAEEGSEMSSISVEELDVPPRTPFEDSGGKIMWWRIFIPFVLALVPVIFYCYAELRLPRPEPDDVTYRGSRRAALDAVVLSVRPSHGGQITRIIARVTKISPSNSASGRIKVNLSSASPPELMAGDLIRIRGRLSPLGEPRLPWFRGYVDSLKRQGVFTECSVDEQGFELLKYGAERLSLGGRFQSAVDRARERLIMLHNKNLGERSGQLLSSMVLGERAVGLDNHLVTTYRNVGLSHILAASGFNLTIVTATTYMFCRAVLPFRMAANILSLLAIFCFVVLAGTSASVMRAALTCTLFILSRCFFRSIHMLAALALSIMVSILIDPFCVSDAGLQLSYVAAAGIITGAGALSNGLQELVRLRLNSTVAAGAAQAEDSHGAVEKDNPSVCAPFFEKSIRALADCISACLIAQISVLPLQLLYFWQTGLLFLPANLLVVPLVAPVTVTGFVSSLIAIANVQSNRAIDSVCFLLDFAAGIPLGWMIAIAEFLASFESARVNLGPPWVESVLLFYLLVSFALFVNIALAHGDRAGLAGSGIVGPASILMALVSAVLLFARPSLPERTVAVFHDCMIVIDKHRNWCAVKTAARAWKAGGECDLSRGTLEDKDPSERKDRCAPADTFEPEPAAPCLLPAQERVLAYHGVQSSAYSPGAWRSGDSLSLELSRHPFDRDRSRFLIAACSPRSGDKCVIAVSSQRRRSGAAIAIDGTRLKPSGKAFHFNTFDLDGFQFRVICCDDRHAIKYGAARLSVTRRSSSR